MAEAARNIAVKSDEKSGPKSSLPAAERAWAPFATLRNEIDRLFDEFSRPMFRFPLGRRAFEAEPLWRVETSLGIAVPAIDIVEKDNEFQVSAELPGMETSNIDIRLSDDLLTIKGEKQEEKVEEKKGYHLSERRYGAFERSFQVPASVDRNKIEATFEKGVLKIALPKSPEAQKREKKIEVKAK